MKFLSDLMGISWYLGEMPDVCNFELIGSALYLPDPKDLDIAVLLRQPSMFETFTCFTFEERLTNWDGWKSCSEYEVGAKFGDWCSVRRGNVNLMLTQSKEFFNGYVSAMEVCKALNLQTKYERVIVCMIVRDGLSALEAIEKASKYK